jgi:hypothetical protein
MLTGTRAFEGDDASDTFAAILRGEPDWSALPANVPSAVTALIRGCLKKDQRERITGMSAALFVLNELELDTAGARALNTSARYVLARHPKSAAVAFLLIGAASRPGFSGASSSRRALPFRRRRSFQSISHRSRISRTPAASGCVVTERNSPGVRRRWPAVFAAARSSGSDADCRYRRTGLYAPRGPFFSADGQWIGFWQGGLDVISGTPYMALKKVSVTGGAPYVICAVDELPFGASWAEDDTILFGGRERIWRVPAAGGKAETVVQLGPGNWRRNLSCYQAAMPCCSRC